MLERGDVLVLVDDEVLVLAADLGRDVLAAAQHADHGQQDVLEVDDAALVLGGLVAGVDARHGVRVEAADLVALRRPGALGVDGGADHGDLGPLDLGGQVAHEGAVGGQAQAPRRDGDQSGLVLLQGRAAPADGAGVEVVELAQGGGVEGACLHSAHAQVAQARAHLAGGAGGEGDGEDLGGVVGAHGDAVGDPVGDGPGLAGAGAREHAHGPLEVLGHRPLVGVEGVEELLRAARARRGGAGRGARVCLAHRVQPATGRRHGR